jgi:hypothetical protein
MIRQQGHFFLTLARSQTLTGTRYLVVSFLKDILDMLRLGPPRWKSSHFCRQMRSCTAGWRAWAGISPVPPPGHAPGPGKAWPHTGIWLFINLLFSFKCSYLFCSYEIYHRSRISHIAKEKNTMHPVNSYNLKNICIGGHR